MKLIETLGKGYYILIPTIEIIFGKKINEYVNIMGINKLLSVSIFWLRFKINIYSQKITSKD